MQSTDELRIIHFIQRDGELIIFWSTRKKPNSIISMVQTLPGLSKLDIQSKSGIVIFCEISHLNERQQAEENKTEGIQYGHLRHLITVI